MVYLDYSVSSGPFLRFNISFEFLSMMFDHTDSVYETRDPSLIKPTLLTVKYVRNVIVVGGVIWIIESALAPFEISSKIGVLNTLRYFSQR